MHTVKDSKGSSHLSVENDVIESSDTLSEPKLEVKEKPWRQLRRIELPEGSETRTS